MKTNIMFFKDMYKIKLERNSLYNFKEKIFLKRFYKWRKNKH